ncbi:unnamed protein product [Allacma fusca]|uniref:CCDC113/CCDC96 coiled-coil domain-containing protein n=1 Tax=Allacma fusca TaxID=39272 RepID=A0A8J2LI11_9HEXA|nr:unnamed protein product [Allacma fusca]
MENSSQKNLASDRDKGHGEEDKEKPRHTNVQPFNDDPNAVDEWDDKLIPEELIQEIWQEQASPYHSEDESEEPYEFVTESGHSITLYRKKGKGKYGQHAISEESSEQGEEELQKVPSMPDVEGGISKAELKQMTIAEIEACIAELQDAMNFVSAENLIFERTIGRMEQRDREIEAAMPVFTYKYSWEMEDDSEDSDSKDGLESDDRDDDCEDDSGESSEEMSPDSNDEDDADDNNEEDGLNEDDEEEEADLQAELDAEIEALKEKNKKKKKEKKINPMIGPDGKIREICEWEDSEDEEYTGDYQAIRPAKEISISKDKFFEGMPIQDRQAVKLYIKSFGEIAPSNYDYMRDKYSKLINFTYKPALTEAGEKTEEKMDVEVRERQQIFDEPEGLGDEDPDFPGFFPRSAKRLPLEYKYKYAEDEDEILEKEIANERTKAYRRENSIQVVIDTNVDAFELLSNLNDDFTEVLKHAYHPLTKKLMAEKILKFRKTIRNKILAEETKITMSLVELQKVRKKVNEQLKTQQEMGFKLQKIDFEQIRIRNNEYSNRIDKAHTELKGLKLLTAGCFQVLKEQRQKLHKKIRQHARMVDDIGLRETLMGSFQTDLQKYTQILNEVQARNNFMRKRIRAFKVPNSMEYIRFKSILYGLQDEVVALRKRLRSLELSKITQQRQLEAMSKGLPVSTLQFLNDNDEWLDEIKNEVQQKNLLCILNEDEMNNVLPEKKIPRKLGESTNPKHPLTIRSKKQKSNFAPTRPVRDAYDPEEDSKSATDLTRFQSNKSRQNRQTFNRLFENKYPFKSNRQAEDFYKVKCGDARYRRGVKGNIVVDTRDRTKLSFLAKC